MKTPLPESGSENLPLVITERKLTSIRLNRSDATLSIVEEAATCGRDDDILTTTVKRVSSEGHLAQTNNPYSLNWGKITAACGALAARTSRTK